MQGDFALGPVDQDLLGFIREHIGSVWALELLLLMRRHPDRDWAAETLVAELRASTSLVRDNVARLQRAGLIISTDEGRYRFFIDASTF